jgi:hypothetical protein
MLNRKIQEQTGVTKIKALIFTHVWSVFYRMASGIKRLVLDVLKPHVPNLVEIAALVGKVEGVVGVNVSLVEVDTHTESIKVTVEGDNLEFEKVKGALEACGASVHSIDQVVAGRTVVEEVMTHMENGG